VWTAVAPAILFALDGFFAVRRALSEPYRIPEVLSPPPWSVAERRALLAQREGRLDAARELWQNAIAAGAPGAAADYQVGLALAAAGRREDAKAAFLRSLSRSPVAPGAAKELGLIALAEGDSANARRLLQRYLAEAGPDPDSLSALAVAAANVGQNTESIEAIEQARLLMAERWKAARLQSRVYARAGDAARTVKSLRALEGDERLDRESLRSDPAYLPIATDPAWIAFLSETPAPAPGPTRRP
jgi:tetratricopeptide (TPR) repeat protein